MKKNKETSVNPKIRLGLLQIEEKKIITILKRKEKELKIKLEELRAIRRLIAEAANELEIEEYEETLSSELKELKEQSSQEKEITESIDSLVNNVKKEIKAGNFQQEYLNLDSQKIFLATSENTISRLYELAYKTNDWSEEESKEFFKIQNAIVQTKQYDLSNQMNEAVSNTYKVLKTVVDKRSEDIKQNYKPAYTTQVKKEFTEPKIIEQTKNSIENLLSKNISSSYKNDLSLKEDKKIK